ncbi:MAG: flagellar filament capping protein FliD, partial [Candidatus Calescibacterium sp.]|nr:flagellar filament capping protein FliD [Candidatus Calescibacterium sp.]
MSINGVYGLDYTSPIQLAKNAKIRVGDSASLVVSPSNTFENLIDGLSITVKGVGESIVSVSKDASKVSSAFMDFVRGFNAVISEVNKLTAKDAPFQGDYTVTGIKSSLTRMIDDLYKYDLVSVKEDGTLELNTSTINSMYNSNPERLKHILQGLKKVV